MLNNTIVSFCIPTYNRKDMVTELVLNILTSQNPHFEIIVVDNYSNDGTVDALKSINDSRLHVYDRCKQVNVYTSWYDTLNKANGDWIFHVNDRDWIDASHIDLLIHTLHELDQQNVGFAIAGEKFSQTLTYKLYPEGYETLKEFALLPSHPTGQIIRKKCWDEISNKEEYFNGEKYGIYPHGYLYAILGNTKKGAYILFDICDKAHYQQRIVNTVSTFYDSNSDRKEWFWPENRYQLLLYAAENVELIEDTAYIKPFMLKRYVKFFYAVTNEWYINCNNAVLKKRYNCPDLETNYLSLLANGFDYITAFREYLDNHDFYWADDEFYSHLCEVDSQLVNGLLTWTEGLRQRGSL